MQHVSIPKTVAERVPEVRYAYYRRCQVFRRNGEQCKAPAEKSSHICYAHAGQLATAVRREQERRAVLGEAVAEMRRKGKPEFEMADLFMDFKAIQVTIAVMAQALIDGRIDCKTAGRLVVELQTMSKLLWMLHRKGRKTLPRINTDNTDLKKSARAEEPRSQQIYAEERRSGRPEELPELPVALTRPSKINAGRNWVANQHEGTRIALVAEVRTLADRRGQVHGRPEWARAA